MADEHLSDAFIKSLHARVVQMEQDIASNAEATARNTSSIETIRQNTQDIVDTFQALSGGFKVLQVAGNLASSTMRRKFNARNYVGGCAELNRWVRGRQNGVMVTLPGLVTRREANTWVCLQS